MKTRLVLLVSMFVMACALCLSCKKGAQNLKSLAGTSWVSYQESGEISINFQNSTFTITEIDDGNAEGVMAGTYVFSFPNVTLTFTNEDGYTESLPGILSGDNLLLMEYVFVRR